MTEVNKGGQPPKLTPERHKAILASIARYVPYEIAAVANGIVEKTLYNWIAWGRRDLDAGVDSEFAHFLQDLKKVEQEKIAKHVEKIDSNVERWQADAWLLERRFWKHFGVNASLISLAEEIANEREVIKNAIRDKEASKKDDQAV